MIPDTKSSIPTDMRGGNQDGFNKRIQPCEANVISQEDYDFLLPERYQPDLLVGEDLARELALGHYSLHSPFTQIELASLRDSTRRLDYKPLSRLSLLTWTDCANISTSRW